MSKRTIQKKPLHRLIQLILVAGTLQATGLSLAAQAAQSPDPPAEESRAEEWRRKRQEKPISSPAARRPGFEKALLYLESRRSGSLYGIRWKDLYPKFGGPRPGSGFGGGVRYYKPHIKGSSVTTEAAALLTMNNYQLFDLQLGKFNRTDPTFFSGPRDLGAPFDFSGKPRPGRIRSTNKTILFADLAYRHFPQERFWGIGNDSKSQDRTSFKMRSASFSGVAGYRFSNWLAAAAGAGLFKVDIAPGTDGRFPTTQERFDDSLAPGLDNQPDFWRVASAVYFNYRDHPGKPHRGGIVGIFFLRYFDRHSDRYSFNRFWVDARHYIPLGSKQRTLALRVYALSDQPDDGNQVPFYLMGTLGGSMTLRGFRDFRFRDANLFHLSAEYRWLPAPALEFALYYDTGKVYPNGTSFAFEHLRKSYGVGVRLKTEQGVVMRFDISRGFDGNRVQFAFGPSF